MICNKKVEAAMDRLLDVREENKFLSKRQGCCWKLECLVFSYEAVRGVGL
jgi:hypothetical protein